MTHLIFDCGGVLVYPRTGDWNLPPLMPRVLGARAADLYTSDYVQAHRLSAHWLDESRMVADVDEERRLRWEYLRSVNDIMHWHLSEEDIQRLAGNFTDDPLRYGFFEDVAPWLRHWKQRFRLGILSDAMPSILDVLRQQGLYDLFDAVVISTQVGAIKPAERMYAAVLEALNAEPTDCAFIDDRACNVEGAAAAGIRAVQMARAAFLPDRLWNGPVVRDFQELNTWLET